MDVHLGKDSPRGFQPSTFMGNHPITKRIITELLVKNDSAQSALEGDAFQEHSSHP